MEGNDGDANINSVLGLLTEPVKRASEAQKPKDAAVSADGRASHEVTKKTKATPTSFDGSSDAGDVKFIIRGWLGFIYLAINTIDIGGCIVWFFVLLFSRYDQGNVWQPMVVLPAVLLINRLSFELSIAIFEIVKHLRQIRDELRKTNTRNIS